MSEREKRLLSFLVVAHAASDSWLILFPTLLFLVALDFQGSYLLLGALANIATASNGVSGILAGILADRMSARRLFLVYGALSSAGAFLVALAPNVVTLGIALAVFGAGVGLYHPVGLSAVTRNIRRRSEALGIHAMSGEIGAGILPTLMVTIGVGLGWRYAFGLAGVLSAALLLLLPMIPLEFDRAKSTPSGRVMDDLARAAKAVGQRRMLAVYASAVMREFAFSGTIVFLPTAIALIGGLGESRIAGISTTGIWTSIVILAGAAGAYVVGKLGERYALEKLLSAATLAPVIPLLVLGVLEGTAFLAILPIVGITISLTGPPVNGLIGKYMERDLQGKGFAALFGVGQVISSFSAVVAGAIASSHGIEWVFPAMALFLFGSLPIQIGVLWRALGREAIPGASGQS